MTVATDAGIASGGTLAGDDVDVDVEPGTIEEPSALNASNIAMRSFMPHGVIELFGSPAFTARDTVQIEPVLRAASISDVYWPHERGIVQYHTPVIHQCAESARRVG